MFTQIISNKCKTSVKFLIHKRLLDMGKDGPSSFPTPTLLFFWGQPGHSRWCVTVRHSFGETSTDEGCNVRILLCVVPLPPCSSQGRKVLRWKLRDARPPATTCFLPQPSAINSLPSKIHPALSDSYCGKSAPSLSEHLEKISSSWKRSLGLSQRTWKIFPKPATPNSAARRFPSLFQPHVGKMTFSSAPQFPLNLSKWRDSSLVIQ